MLVSDVVSHMCRLQGSFTFVEFKSCKDSYLISAGEQPGMKCNSACTSSFLHLDAVLS